MESWHLSVMDLNESFARIRAIIRRKLSTAWDQRSKLKQFPFSNSQVNQVQKLSMGCDSTGALLDEELPGEGSAMPQISEMFKSRPQHIQSSGARQ